MWSEDSSANAAQRSSVVGLAFLGGVCQSTNKFTIIEEQGGFSSIGIIAHELGHK